MRSLDITQAKLDNQRQAVQEERRLRVDNQPYGRSYERFDEVFYDNFAYKHSTIGSMEDLNAASSTTSRSSSTPTTRPTTPCSPWSATSSEMQRWR